MSQCMAKAYACRTHGMPCVNMHGTFEGYIWSCSYSLVRGKKEEEGKKRKGGEEKNEREERKREMEERRK